MNKRTFTGRVAAVVAAAALATAGGVALASTSSAATGRFVPESYSGDNGALQIAVAGEYLHVTSWKASSVGAPVHPTPSVRVDFIEYDRNPHNAARVLISESHVYLGHVTSFDNVSAPASAVNRNYANGHYLCVQSNAFMGKPCAQMIG